jgi:hypothetical protein
MEILNWLENLLDPEKEKPLTVLLKYPDANDIVSTKQYYLQ